MRLQATHPDAYRQGMDALAEAERAAQTSPR